MSQRWVSDAADIDIGENLTLLVYLNQALRGFIEGSNKCFLSASKGMGKTLLLTFKRYHLEQRYRASPDSEAKAVRFIPSDRPYLDFMAPLPSVRRELQDVLADVSTSTRVWGLALRLSALANSPSPLVDRDLLDELPTRVTGWIEAGAGHPPTIFCHELLQLSVSELNRLYDSTRNPLEVALRAIHSGLFFFIDKVDQACEDLPLESWIGFQAGLIMAASELHISNAHVKVYASIRQEAWANFVASTRANIAASVTELSYTPSELLEMINGLTECYEKKPTLAQFLGFSEVENSRARCREDCFRYIYRHTLGRPRDLVRIAEGLSNHGDALDEDVFKQTVNRISSELIGGEVFAEVSVFLDSLRETSRRGDLFAAIPYNILTRSEVDELCCDFNDIPSLDGYLESGIDHPFCELYCSGLLGVLRKGTGKTEWEQRFKRPNDTLNRFRRELPPSKYYFVHPGLQEIVKQANSAYEVFKFVPVGDYYRWDSRVEAFANVQREIHRLSVLREDAKREVLVDDQLTGYVRRVLEVVQGDGSSGTKSRRELVQREAGGAWEYVRERCARRQELRELDFWLEQAVDGGREH